MQISRRNIHIRDRVKYRNRNFYTQAIDIELATTSTDTKIAKKRFYAIYSYDTLIGFADMGSHEFKTWGYGYYSTTTSKQITMFAHEMNLTIKHISKTTLEDYLKGK